MVLHMEAVQKSCNDFFFLQLQRASHDNWGDNHSPAGLIYYLIP